MIDLLPETVNLVQVVVIIFFLCLLFFLKEIWKVNQKKCAKKNVQYKEHSNGWFLLRKLPTSDLLNVKVNF